MDRPYHVLVVEDDELTLELTVAYLAAMEIEATTARSGEEGIRILESYSPDLIISDVKMDGMDGYEFCRRVREGGLDDIPFIFVSGLGSLPQRIKGLKLGADDYLTKPVDPEELILKVTTLIEKNRRVLHRLSQVQGLTSNGVMKGKLGEIEVTSLLQLFDLVDAGETRIRVAVPGGEVAEIYLRGGMVRHVSLGDLSGERAFFRLLLIDEGEFAVERRPYEGRPTMAVPVQKALMDGVTKVDEYRRLVRRLGSGGDSFRVTDSSAALDGRLGEEATRILALVDERGDLDEILAASPLDELETLRILTRLRQADAIREAP